MQGSLPKDRIAKSATLFPWTTEEIVSIAQEAEESHKPQMSERER